jgi:hypothetical protein
MRICVLTATYELRVSRKATYVTTLVLTIGKAKVRKNTSIHRVAKHEENESKYSNVRSASVHMLSNRHLRLRGWGPLSYDRWLTG